ELLNQVDNPRWLLRLHTPGSENKGAYYLPVPTELARRKTDAEVLQENMRQATGLVFDLIYTRTPIGREHLLAARLLDLRPSQKRRAKRDVLWR
ncbi:MAG: hypothetical protein KDC54_02570, partial [Lewinella sp.]|nr:hypothetical protein [Lewinella sp.]